MTLFWSAAFIGASIALVIQLVRIVEKYFDKPIRTTVEVVREPMQFPDVTICPLRNLDIGIVKSILNQSINRTTGATRTKHPYAILAENHTRSNDEFERIYYAGIGKYSHLFFHYYEKYTDLFGMLTSRTIVLPNMPYSVLKTAGTPVQEMLLRCKWQGNDCDIENNIKSDEIDPYFLTCVTFRAPNKTVMSEGVEGGLSIAGIYGHGMYLSSLMYLLNY